MRIGDSPRNNGGGDYCVDLAMKDAGVVAYGV